MLKMKTALMAAGALVLATLGACSDSPTANDQASVTMQSQLEGSRVTLFKASSATSAVGIDSISVTSIKMFVRRMKLHRDGSDTASDRQVKTDPFVVTFEQQAKTFASLSMPAGTFNKIKFEFHRPESNQIDEYLAIPELAPFVTDGRSSVIYTGNVYVDGAPAPLPFTYRSDMTANLSLNFDQAVTFAEGTTSTVLLQIDPTDVFKKGGQILDPRDERNENEIDNNIKASIHMHKH